MRHPIFIPEHLDEATEKLRSCYPSYSGMVQSMMEAAGVKLGHLSFLNVHVPEPQEGSRYFTIQLNQVIIIYRLDESGDWFPVETICTEHFVKEYYMLYGELYHVSVLHHGQVPLPLLALY